MAVTPTTLRTNIAVGTTGQVAEVNTLHGAVNALTKTVQIETPEQYGAVGNGVADDTAAVRAAFDAATAARRAGLTGTIYHPGATVVLKGIYNLPTLAAPIDVSSNVQGSTATLIAPAAYAGIVLRVGHAASGSILQTADIKLPDVTKPATAGPLTAGSVGVRVQNLYNSRLDFGRVAYFETGHHYTGLGNGTVYNTVNIGWISYCKVSMRLVPDTGGWVNQNTFIGGGVQQSPSFDGGGTRRTGWRHVVIDGAGINAVDMNKFIGTSFEGDASAYHIDITQGRNNTFDGCRFEQGTAGTAVTVSGDTITSTAHGLAVGDMLTYSASVSPTGMFLAVPYYVVTVPDTDTYKVSQKKAGTAITFTSGGTSVVHFRPSRILFTGTLIQDNLIRDSLSRHGVIEIVNPSAGGTGNAVQSTWAYTIDTYIEDDLPLFRARNRNSAPLKRPIFAAYPATVNPVEDPHGWTTALSNRGLVIAAAGAEVGALSAVSGAGLSYKAISDSAPYEVASCRRTPSLISVSALSCAANTTTSTTFTLTGANTNEHVLVTPLAVMTAGIVLSHAYISSANTVTVVFGNLTAGAISLTVSLQAVAFRRFL
jgi:hypothetical protein